MNDSPAARWTALILIALMMFFGYMFVDVMSPLQALIEQQRGWSPDVFGTYASAEYILNVCGFLILAGIILDKMGVRFTGILSASMMFIGASIKYIGITDWFQTTAFCEWLGQLLLLYHIFLQNATVLLPAHKHNVSQLHFQTIRHIHRNHMILRPQSSVLQSAHILRLWMRTLHSRNLL